MLEVIIGYARDHIGEILSVIALIAAVYFYRKSRRYIGAAYYISTDSLIGPMGPRYEGLEILYDGSNIQSFASSKVFLWNRGTEAIRRQDIAPAAPLSINVRAPDRALDCKVIYCSGRYSKIDIASQGDQRLLVVFDFLNPRDGCVFEILHTGDSRSLSMTGGIIGSGDIRQTNPAPEAAVQNHVFAALGAGMAALLGLTFTVLPAWFREHWEDADLRLLAMLILLVVASSIIASRKLTLWLSGGAAFKRLCDGYAKQEQDGAGKGGSGKV